jgi:DNA-binding NtrC family response regulator
MPPTLLLVDDDPDIALAAQLALEPLSLRFVAVQSPAAALEALRAGPVAVLLLDLNFRRGHTRGDEGLALLARLRAEHGETEVVVVTAHAGVELAVQAMQQGAVDFVTKPWANERLRATVAQALALHESRHAAAQAQRRVAELARAPAGAAAALLGHSAPMQRLRSLVERVASTDANVLVLGENGVGKELVAQALHRASPRRDAPLVTVDLGAVAPTLFESELFGHRRGAFTDARSDRTGRIAAADGGSLFLDELGNLPLTLQPRLLAVLERREVLPVGANTPLAVDLRVISATNLPREALADETQFRADLLFRLNTVEIVVPALRERQEDIPLLAEHFLQHHSARHGKPLRPFSEAALRAMQQHPWPGNVRALRHAVERAVVLALGPRIGPDDLALGPGLPAPLAAAARRGTLPAAGQAQDLRLEAIERQHIERVLALRGWNISHAAADLGLSRASLYRRMQRHGL